MSDEFAIRKTARRLEFLFRELEDAKLSTSAPQRERTMKPAPGPQTPGNSRAVDGGIDMSGEFRDWCTNLRSTIDTDKPLPKPEDGGDAALAEWVATHAFYIAETPDVEAFFDELKRWERTLEKMVGRGPDLEDLRKKPEPWQSARSICAHLNNAGLTTNRDMLRKWAERGHITRKDMRDGSAGYRISDVKNYLSERDQ